MELILILSTAFFSGTVCGSLFAYFLFRNVGG